jgi:hypothetical protein
LCVFLLVIVEPVALLLESEPCELLGDGSGSGKACDRGSSLERGVKTSPPPNVTTCPFVDFVVLPPGHGRSVTDF